MEKNIKKELEEFKKFKETYNYTSKEIEEINGKEYYDGEPLIDEDGNEIETLYDFTLDAENKEQLVAELRDVIKENILD